MNHKQKHPKTVAVTALSALLVSFVIGLSACSDMNLDASEGEGTMNFHMTNTPASSQAAAGNSQTTNSPESSDEELQSANLETLQEVNIDVQAIRIHYSASRADTINADSIVVEEDPSSGRKWIDVPIEPTTINLLELTDADILFTSADLPEGFYSQIRLILGTENEVVDENGDSHTLHVPSGQQSGYKIMFDGRLHSGEVMDLTINFDAENSIRVTGNNRYMLHPVFHAFNGRL